MKMVTIAIIVSTLVRVFKGFEERLGKLEMIGKKLQEYLVLHDRLVKSIGL